MNILQWVGLYEEYSSMGGASSVETDPADVARPRQGVNRSPDKPLAWLCGLVILRLGSPENSLGLAIKHGTRFALTRLEPQRIICAPGQEIQSLPHRGTRR